jgi:hypothetical protein
MSISIAVITAEKNEKPSKYNLKLYQFNDQSIDGYSHLIKEIIKYNIDSIDAPTMFKRIKCFINFSIIVFIFYKDYFSVFLIFFAEFYS